MSDIRYLDPVSGDDADDGLTLANAKKTVVGIRDMGAAYSGNDPNEKTIVKVAPGFIISENEMDYVLGHNDMGCARWEAIEYGTVTIRPNGNLKPFINTGVGLDNANFCRAPQFYGIKFKDWAQPIVNKSTGTAPANQNIAIEYCHFSNCSHAPLGGSFTWACNYRFNTHDGCTGSFRPAQNALGGGSGYGVQDNNVWYNCSNFYPVYFSSSLTSVRNNVYKNCNFSRSFYSTSNHNSSSYEGKINYNHFDNCTFSSDFAHDGGTSYADLAAWQAAGYLDQDTIEGTADLLDAAKGVFYGVASGNLDRTGFGEITKGIGVALAQSNNLTPTDWGNAAINPPGEAVLVDGNWEHAGTPDTVVTITLPEEDWGKSWFVRFFDMIVREDYPASIVDSNLSDITKTFEIRYGINPVGSDPWVEYSVQTPVDQFVRYVQRRITLRNDGQ